MLWVQRTTCLKVTSAGMGQDQRRPDAALGADGAEDVGGLGTLVVGRPRTATAPGPAAGDLVLLTDPRFVLPPQLYPGIRREVRPDFRHSGGP